MNALGESNKRLTAARLDRPRTCARLFAPLSQNACRREVAAARDALKTAAEAAGVTFEDACNTEYAQRQ